MGEFFKDLLYWEKQKVISKMADFLKRNYFRVRRTSSHIWEEVKHIGKGFVTLKDDIKGSVTDVKDLHYARYKKPTYSHTQKIQQITQDVIKFIPFSIFILIPGLELLLPAWLVIFPNAIPSQFQSKNTRQKKMDELLMNRNNGAEKLLYKFPKYLKTLSNSSILSKKEKEELEELLKLVDSNNAMHTDYLRYKHLFTKYADFKHFKVTSLQEMAHFMGLSPVTGLNIINNVLSFLGMRIQIDNKYVSWLTKIILTRELRLFFRKIRREDSYLYWEKVESLEENKLDSILIERGIEIVNKPIPTKLKDYKMWQAISNLNNAPDTMLLFCRLNEFAEDLYRMTALEHEIDLIRRVGSDREYIRRKKKLEEYLNIANVKSEISHFIKEKNALLEDGETAKTPDQEQQKENVVSVERYYKFKKSYQEFQVRHNSIVDQIDNINEELEDLLEELEQNVILGYLDNKADIDNPQVDIYSGKYY